MHTQYPSLQTAFILELPGQELEPEEHFCCWRVGLGVAVVIAGGGAVVAGVEVKKEKLVKLYM